MSRARPPHRRACVVVLALSAAFAIANIAPADAQIRLSNLLEARVGENPFQPTLPGNKNEIYDLVDLDAQLSMLRLGLRFETYRSGYETDGQPGYAEFTQRYADWTDTHFRGRVGNFYTIIGRGLLHRSFELTGVILDDVGFASRYTPSRDVDGVLAEVTYAPVAVRALMGSPSLGEVSPSGAQVSKDFERHRGEIAGGQTTLDIWRGSQVGLGYMRFSGEFSGQQEYATVFTKVDPLRLFDVKAVQLPIYAEVARKNADWGREWTPRADAGDTAAVYAGANLLVGPISLSAEWKDYRAFRLGSNDPPSLVREHGYYLLNRSTHFLDADREQGYQLEGAYTLPAWGTFTLNFSRADGANLRRSATELYRPRFEERYAEIHFAPDAGTRGEATVFYQRGKDTFVTASISDRTIAGGAGTLMLPREFAVTLDVEGLEATRVNFFGVPVADFKDRYVAVGVTRAGWGGVAVSWERTNDPEAEAPEDQAATPFEVQANTFMAVVLSADFGDRHDASLFLGERRGGPACTAGTCYIVEPFRGAELRVTSRF